MDFVPNITTNVGNAQVVRIVMLSRGIAQMGKSWIRDCELFAEIIEALESFKIKRAKSGTLMTQQVRGIL